MHLKRIAAVTAVASAALLLASNPAYAAFAYWEGDVDSGGLAKVFDTQRTATQHVFITVNKTADAGITLVACTNLAVVSGEWHIPVGDTEEFGATANKCFRQEIRRWVPKDTNGVLPGNGVTTEKGQITW